MLPCPHVSLMLGMRRPGSPLRCLAVLPAAFWHVATPDEVFCVKRMSCTREVSGFGRAAWRSVAMPWSCTEGEMWYKNSDVYKHT